MLKTTPANLKRTYAEKVFPKVSILILASINEPELHATLVSVLKQNYPDFEVIVALSEDAVGSDLKSIVFQEHEKVQYFSFGKIAEIPLLNVVLTHLQGVYVQILFPGYLYLTPYALHDIMQTALEHQSPSLIYTACILSSMPYKRSSFHPLSKEMLRQGIVPTELGCCLIRRDLFEELGSFEPAEREDYGWNFFCRCTQSQKLHSFGIHRVFMEHQRNKPVSTEVSLWHTFQRVRRIFGIKAAFAAVWNAFKRS